MDLSFVPKNPTYALLRYMDEGIRIIQAGMGILETVKPIVEASPTEIITDQRVVDATRMTQELVFQRIVDNFQTYVVDVIAEIFSSKPEMIPSGDMDRKLLFEDRSLTEIRIQAVESLLRSYSYKSMSDLSILMANKFSFPLLQTHVQKKIVDEAVSVRNLLVHNRGMTDYRYRSDFTVGKRNRGTRIDIPNELETLEKLTEVAADIDKRAQTKFNLEQVPSKNA